MTTIRRPSLTAAQIRHLRALCDARPHRSNGRAVEGPQAAALAAQIAEHRAAGVRVVDLIAAVGPGAYAVYQARRARPVHVDADQVVRLRAAGRTWEAIAGQLGVSRAGARAAWVKATGQPPPRSAPGMLTASQAAAILGCNPRTLRRWADQGRLRPVLVGTQRRYDPAEIARLRDHPPDEPVLRPGGQSGD